MGKIEVYYILIFFNALISLIFIVFNGHVFGTYFFFSLVIFVIILIKNSDNVIFFIRTIFLGMIGFIALGAKLYNQDAWFGYHMQDSQTFEIASLMFLLSNIALFSSEIGFLFGAKIKQRQHASIHFENRLFFVAIFSLLLIVVFLITMSHGSLVIAGGSYASGEETVSMPVSNLNVISNILFYTLILLYFKFKDLYQVDTKRYFYSIIFIALYLFLFAEFLRGVRMDALNGIFGAIILYLVYTNKGLKITPIIFLVGIVLFVTMQIMGLIRSAPNFLSFDEIIDILILGFTQLLVNSDSGIMFYQGTVNDIATTFSGTIMMLKENMIDYYYGGSYFDYILRTPPSILYPDRPQDLAWIFANHGLTSGGGYFELAEAYLNFGVLGAFIVPFIISFLLSSSFKMFVLNKYSIFHSILLFSLLSGFMRGVLYQTFTFYKAVVTGFIIYFIFYILIGILNMRKNKLSDVQA